MGGAAPPAFDGVIAGAGAAGLLAALRAHDAGGRVALLDSFEAEQSNLWTSSGLFSAAGTRFQHAAGVDDSPARWAADISRKTRSAVDPVILSNVTRRSAEATMTLRELGIDQMTVGERIALVQEILESVAAEQPRPPLSEAKRQELRRRIADQESNPGDETPWDEVYAATLARLAR